MMRSVTEGAHAIPTRLRSFFTGSKFKHVTKYEHYELFVGNNSGRLAYNLTAGRHGHDQNYLQT